MGGETGTWSSTPLLSCESKKGGDTRNPTPMGGDIPSTRMFLLHHAAHPQRFASP